VKKLHGVFQPFKSSTVGREGNIWFSTFDHFS
jgi:hypothetical protein